MENSVASIKLEDLEELRKVGALKVEKDEDNELIIGGGKLSDEDIDTYIKSCGWNERHSSAESIIKTTHRIANGLSSVAEHEELGKALVSFYNKPGREYGDTVNRIVIEMPEPYKFSATIIDGMKTSHGKLQMYLNHSTVEHGRYTSIKSCAMDLIKEFEER